MPRAVHTECIFIFDKVCLVGLVCRVYLVYLVCLVCLVYLVEPDQPDRPNEPDRPDRPEQEARLSFAGLCGQEISLENGTMGHRSV